MPKDSSKKQITPEDVVALSKLMMGVAAFLKWLAVQEEPPKKAGPVRQRATSLLRFYMARRNMAVEHLAWMVDQPGASRLQVHLKRARMGGTPGEKAVNQARFIGEACLLASTRQTMRDKLFGTGNPAQIAKTMGGLYMQDPVALVLGLLKTPEVGDGKLRQATREWLKRVADLMQVSGGSEERMADIASVQSIATEIKDLDRRLKVIPPNSNEAYELQADRSTKMDTLMKVADGTGDTQAALGAASGIIYTNQSHATETGKQLGLTEEQEDAMMVTGQALIAAGAGSGKTRVLAGKVVDIIKREGGKSSQIIATSFSKKSSLELKDRVLKYGGAGILDAGDKGFSTTHAIANNVLRAVSPKTAAKELLKGGAETKLISIAMRQVEMTSDNAFDLEETKGFFEGVFESKKGENVNLGDLDEDGSLLVPLSKEVGKSDFDWDSRGEEVGQAILDKIQSGALNKFRGSFGDWLHEFAGNVGNSMVRGRNLAQGKKSPSTNQLKHIKTILNASSVDLGLVETIGSIFDTAQKGSSRGHKWASHDLPVISELLTRTTFDEMSATDMQVLEKLVGLKRYARDISEEGLEYLNQKMAGSDQFVQWKNRPANQWFNIQGEWVDEEGRAIGAKRVSLMIGKYRAALISPSQAWAEAKAEGEDGSLLKFAAAYGAYVWLKENDPEASKMMDFTDMQELLVKEMIANPKVLKNLQAQYKWILVDEAQDLNKLQHLLFGLIAGAVDPETQEYKADGSMTANTFCFIGDDKQAIYEFRGATPDEFTEKSDLRKGQFQTKVITSNFRSGKQIVDCANKLIAHNEKQIPMICSTNPERGQGQIEYEDFGTYQQAAVGAAEEIEAMIERDGWSEDPPSFGIAVRTNAEAMAFGVELIKRKIPFRSKYNFFNDPLTTGIVGWLQVAASSGNVEAINRAVLNAHKNPSFFLNEEFNKLVRKKAKGKNYLEWLTANWDSVYEDRETRGGRVTRLAWRNRKNVKPYVDMLNQIAGSAAGKSAVEMFEQVVNIEGVKGTSILEYAIESVKKDGEKMDTLWEEADGGAVTEEMIRDFAFAPLEPLMSLLRGSEDLSGALSYIEELQRTAEKVGAFKDVDQKGGMKDRKKNAVNIDTCHGWKGLEAINMWVPMAKGTFPMGRGDLASERRLAYVALTRGRDNVKVLCPERNHRGQDTEGLSRFIEEACIPQMGGEEAEVEQTKQASVKSAQEWLRTVDVGADFDLDELSLTASYGQVISFGSA